MAYTKKTIINKVTATGKPLYQRGCVNNIGQTTDTGEYYTEVIAQYILDNLAAFKGGIHKVTRCGSYKVVEHKWYDYDPKVDTIIRKEEHFARSLYGETIGVLSFLDYQVPLKNANDDENKGLGKIDLFAFDGRSLVILELKRSDSLETLLRCVLESYTYLNTVDKDKLATDFGYKKGTPLRAAALVFEDSLPYKERERPLVRKLMETLDVGLYVMDNETSKNIKQIV